jgi:glycosyltransferase involved in cell wall biosynthesis
MCLESIKDNDYPKDKLEILVFDGMSEDKTRDIIKKYSEKYPFIKYFENANKIQSSAMNIGLRYAKGDIIIRMDAHTTYAKDYFLKCINCLDKYNADNVGGIWITMPGNDTAMAKAIALSLSHPFGVGNSYFRIGLKEPKSVDTVPFGCYRKEVFDRIGMFNEHLVRNQDIEFNIRLKNAGGKIILVPDIESYYYARSTLKALAKNNFWNGFWVIYSTKFAKMPFSVRHLIPLVFVTSVMSSLIGSIFYAPLAYIFSLIFTAYFITALFFSINISFSKSLKLIPLLVSTFFTLHFSYGLGSLWGFTKLFADKLNFSR